MQYTIEDYAQKWQLLIYTKNKSLKSTFLFRRRYTGWQGTIDITAAI